MLMWGPMWVLQWGLMWVLVWELLWEQERLLGLLMVQRKDSKIHLD